MAPLSVTSQSIYEHLYLEALSSLLREALVKKPWGFSLSVGQPGLSVGQPMLCSSDSNWTS